MVSFFKGSFSIFAGTSCFHEFKTAAWVFLHKWSHIINFTVYYNPAISQSSMGSNLSTSKLFEAIRTLLILGCLSLLCLLLGLWGVHFLVELGDCSGHVVFFFGLFLNNFLLRRSFLGRLYWCYRRLWLLRLRLRLLLRSLLLLLLRWSNNSSYL